MRHARPQCNDQNFADALEKVTAMLEYRRAQKGDGIFVSSHEVLGVLTDELQEYRDEVHAKSSITELKEAELIDIAVGALWGIASGLSDQMDW